MVTTNGHAQAVAKIYRSAIDLNNGYIKAVWESNPIALFPLDESSGTTIDNVWYPTENGTASGTLTYQQIQTLAHKSDYAIKFSTDGAITATISGIKNSVGDPTTVEFWMYWNGSTVGVMPFAFNTNYSDLYIENTTKFGFNTGAGDNYGFNPTAAGMAGKWSHVAVIFYHGQNYNISNKIYINGVQQTLSQLTGSAQTMNTNDGIWISGWTDVGYRFNNGIENVVAIYDRALTSDEIMAHYLAGQNVKIAQAQATIRRSEAYAQAAAMIPASLYTLVVEDDNPGFYFKLDEASGTTAYATRGTNGTYSATGITYQVASPITGEIFPYAVSVAGAGSLTSNNSEYTTNFTIELWAKPNATATVVSEGSSGVTGTSGQRYIAYPNQKGGNRGAGISAGTNVISVFEHGDGNLYAPIVQTGTFTKWTHIVVVYSSRNPSLYINGVFQQSGTGGAGTVYSPTLFIHNHSYGPYNGAADEIAVYNKVLTADEILEHYNAALPKAYAQAQAIIIQSRGFGQAQAIINQSMYVAQAQASIKSTYTAHAQSSVHIKAVNVNAVGQAQTVILTELRHAQAQVYIRIANNNAYAQTRTDIKRLDIAWHANAGAQISNFGRGYAYSQGYIKPITLGVRKYGQAISQVTTKTPNAQAAVNIALSGSVTVTYKHAQANAQIIDPTTLNAYVSTQSVAVLVQNLDESTAYVSTQSVSVLVKPIEEATAYVSTQSISVLIQHYDYRGFGNAQATIKAQMGIGQARATVGPPLVVAQAQATVSKLVNKVALAQAKIGHFGFGYAQARIKTYYQSYAQANAFIVTRLQFAQARPYIKRFEQAYGQAQAYYKMAQQTGQAQANIFSSITSKIRVTQVGIESVHYGTPKPRITQIATEVTIRRIPAPFARVTQAGIESVIKSANPNARLTQAGIEILIKPATYTLVYAQAQATIIRTIAWGQAQGTVWYLDQLKSAQAQARISYAYIASGLAKAQITGSPPRVAQAQARILNVYLQYAQAESWIIKASAWAQAQADIFATYQQYSQANAFISKQAGYANAQGTILHLEYNAFGQALAWIIKEQMFAQAQALIFRYQGYGQARAYVIAVQWLKNAQAQGTLKIRNNNVYAQAEAYIYNRIRAYAQAAAMFGNFKPAQAEAYIHAYNVGVHGNAQADIDNGGYLVRFDGISLPGYANQEMYDSYMRIFSTRAPYIDGTLNEYQGLRNKNIDITMTVMGDTYEDCKAQVQQAATIVRRKKDDFARLYVQRRDRYYMVLTQSIQMEKDAKASRKSIVYQVAFESKPWRISEATYVISGGSGTLSATRTIYDGGYTPTILTLTGTDITVSGYTNTIPFTGFISVSGAVSNLVIDTENYTATINGQTANEYMSNLDYGLYVGVGTTYFEITGATESKIEYNNRWYL